MRTHRLIILACCVTLPLLARPVLATDVTFRLVDQSSTLIAGSQFVVDGNDVMQDGTVTLAEGTHAVTAFAGVFGESGSALYRDEMLDVSGASQTAEFVWKTAPLTLRVEDQHGALLSGSELLFLFGAGAPIPPQLGNGVTVDMPITEDAGSPPILGSVSGGYSFQIYPGIFGGPGSSNNRLWRDEGAEELTVSGATRTFVWKTAPLTLRLEDQHGALMPGAELSFLAGDGGIPFQTVPNGATVQMPITEDAGTTPIFGALTDGYAFQVTPGILGASGGSHSRLWRNDGPQELTMAGTTRTMIWKTASITLRVVDPYGALIPASTLELLNGPGGVAFHDQINDETVELPVTNDASSRPIHGALADGYAVNIYPGILGASGGNNNMLWRTEVKELTETGGTWSFVWRMVAGRICVVDSVNTTSANAQILLPVLGEQSAGIGVALPVTQDAQHPATQGIFATGYRVSIRPTPSDPLSTPLVFELVAEGFTPAFVSADGVPYGLRFGVCTATVDVPSGSTERPFECHLVGATPARGSAIVMYSVPGRSSVRIQLFDVGGRRIETLDEGFREPGTYEAALGRRAGALLTSGIYFIHVTVGNRNHTLRAIVLD